MSTRTTAIARNRSCRKGRPQARNVALSLARGRQQIIQGRKHDIWLLMTHAQHRIALLSPGSPAAIEMHPDLALGVGPQLQHTHLPKSQTHANACPNSRAARLLLQMPLRACQATGCLHSCICYNLDLHTQCVARPCGTPICPDVHAVPPAVGSWHVPVQHAAAVAKPHATASQHRLLASGGAQAQAPRPGPRALAPVSAKQHALPSAACFVGLPVHTSRPEDPQCTP
jgi:hypothetical protein